MLSPSDPFALVYGLVQFVLFIPAFWIACQTLPRVYRELANWLGALPASRWSWMALCLALASLVLLPLTDLFHLLFSFAQILTPANWSQQPYATLAGSVPYPLYLMLEDGILLVSYAYAIGVGRQAIQTSRMRTEEIGSLSWSDRLLIFFVAGSLINRILAIIILGAMNLHLPIGIVVDVGLPGFLALGIIGIVLLAIVMIALNRYMDRALKPVRTTG